MYFHTVHLELADGITVRLISLDQEMHYERIVVGLPTSKSNARLLERLKAKGAYIVWAPEALEHSTDHFYCGERLAQLPPIMCTTFVVRDNNLAQLVWFQADWAMPIAPDVITALRAVDWTAVPQEIYI